MSTASVKLPKLAPIEVKVGHCRQDKSLLKLQLKLQLKFVKICIGVNDFSSRSDPEPYCSKIFEKLQKCEKFIKKSSKWRFFDDFFTFLHFFQNFTKIRSKVATGARNIYPNTHFL